MAIPTILEELLKPYPPDVKLKLREALEKLKIVNKDDPMLELLLVLGLWGTYYKLIPEFIAAEGKKIEESNEKTEAALNRRVRELQGVAHLLQRAHDEIEKTVPAEVAKNVAARVNKAIAELPLTSFTETISQASSASRIAADTAEASSKKVKEAVDTIDGYADQLKNLPSPFWRNVGFALLGAAITAGVGWWFVVKPMKADQPALQKVADTYLSESFIGRRSLAGFINGQPMIIIDRDNWESYREDPQTGRLTVLLKK